MLSCSDQANIEKVVKVEKHQSEIVVKEVSLIKGKWIVLDNACKDTFELSGIEAINIDNQTVKMGNQFFNNGIWETTEEEQKAELINFIDSELSCIKQNSGSFKFYSYLINSNSIAFAISEDNNLVVRKVADKISVATTYSEQRVKEVLSFTPFTDEPLPYDPFSVDVEITDKTE